MFLDKFKDSGDFLDMGMLILRTEVCKCPGCVEAKKGFDVNSPSYGFARKFALAPILLRFRAVAENWLPDKLKEELGIVD